jgi:hypothetical protein
MMVAAAPSEKLELIYQLSSIKFWNPINFTIQITN